uniref:Uncharacterized protein n=1 Tax=Rhizophora mucronata TaxID=61149 RepID=A0A2P2P3T0_RHIMU
MNHCLIRRANANKHYFRCLSVIHNLVIRTIPFRTLTLSTLLMAKFL